MNKKTKPQAAPTPRPWKQDAGLISGHDGVEVADLDYPGGEENAALIVRAVNAHDGLVNALRAVWDESDGGWKRDSKTAQEARAALKAAGEDI